MGRVISASRSRLAEMIKAGVVPKPVRFGQRCVGWLGRTIHDYQRQFEEK
jgi:predicted DNA-binding transcriptional regulator AlpA